MKLPQVVQFLKSCPRAMMNGDETNITVQCPFCGDSQKSDHGHFSIKLEIDPGEGMPYQCFRADCGETGILTTETLQLLGCSDPGTLLELASHNRTISGKLEKGFSEKYNHNYQVVNLSLSDNEAKLDYINHRLGVNFRFEDLQDFKIQLGLYDFLRGNYINTLAFKKEKCDLLDQYSIGFLSMYSDYLICRDITQEQLTGLRYTMYRIRGKSTENDKKLYCIPTKVDLLDPHPADINIAEGTFSILGAYLHTKKGRDHPNNLWLANCGSGYKNTLLHVVKQFGLYDVNLHIWSDSEIGIRKYEKLVQDVQDRMNLRSCHVYYNSKAEDFGVPGNQIKVEHTEL